MPTGYIEGHSMGNSLLSNQWDLAVIVLGCLACVVLGIGIGILIKSRQSLPLYPGKRSRKKKNRR